MLSRGVHNVPLHLRTLHRVGNSPNHAIEDAEAGVTRRLLGPGEQQLLADTDSEERNARVDAFEGDLIKAGVAQGVDTWTEGANPRKDHRIGSGDEPSVGCEPSISAGVLKPFMGGVKVANAVVKNRY
jgi:hypothetical protein